MNRDKIFNLVICLTFSITLISIITALQLGLRYDIKQQKISNQGGIIAFIFVNCNNFP